MISFQTACKSLWPVVDTVPPESHCHTTIHGLVIRCSLLPLSLLINVPSHFLVHKTIEKPSDQVAGHQLGVAGHNEVHTAGSMNWEAGVSELRGPFARLEVLSRSHVQADTHMIL